MVNNLKALQKDIKRIKAKLQMQEACENFGQKEYRDLEAKYNPYFNYDISTDERNAMFRELESFNDWCMNYCG